MREFTIAKASPGLDQKGEPSGPKPPYLGRTPVGLGQKKAGRSGPVNDKPLNLEVNLSPEIPADFLRCSDGGNEHRLRRRGQDGAECLDCGLLFRESESGYEVLKPKGKAS